MSIATQISRLQTAKSSLKTAIEAKGVTVPSTAKLDTYDTYVSQIVTGGTSTTPSAFTSWEFDDWGKATNIVVKNGQTTIQEHWQEQNKALTACTLPNTITAIGNYSFANCSNLSTLHITTACTTLGTSALSNIGTLAKHFDVSDINLGGIVPSTSFASIFNSSYLKGTLTIPNNCFSNANSGYTTTMYQFLYNVHTNGSNSLTVDAYCDGVIIPRSCFHAYYLSNNSDGVNIRIHGTPSFLSAQSFSTSSGGSITFVDCTTPPDGAATGSTTSSTSPFYGNLGTIYVPSSGLSAWQTKYSGFSSKIKAIGT